MYKKNFKKDKGYTLLEYAAAAVLIATIIGLTITSIGGGMNDLENGINALAAKDSKNSEVSE